MPRPMRAPLLLALLFFGLAPSFGAGLGRTARESWDRGERVDDAQNIYESVRNLIWPEAAGTLLIAPNDQRSYAVRVCDEAATACRALVTDNAESFSEAEIRNACQQLRYWSYGQSAGRALGLIGGTAALAKLRRQLALSERRRVQMGHSLICDHYYDRLAGMRKLDKRNMKKQGLRLGAVIMIGAGVTGPQPEKSAALGKALCEAMDQPGRAVKLKGPGDAEESLGGQLELARKRQRYAPNLLREAAPEKERR